MYYKNPANLSLKVFCHFSQHICNDSIPYFVVTKNSVKHQNNLQAKPFLKYFTYLESNAAKPLGKTNAENTQST